MRFVPALFALLLVSACGTTPADDVTRFAHKREMCEYYTGEEPYEFGRREFLRAQIIETCTGSDQELARLREKYAGNEEVLRELSVYERTGR